MFLLELKQHMNHIVKHLEIFQQVNPKLDDNGYLDDSSITQITETIINNQKINVQNKNKITNQQWITNQFLVWTTSTTFSGSCII